LDGPAATGVEMEETSFWLLGEGLRRERRICLRALGFGLGLEGCGVEELEGLIEASWEEMVRLRVLGKEERRGEIGALEIARRPVLATRWGG
jgi:hypothetical protein